MTIDPARWYPVASAGDLPHGHVYQTALGGCPLAIWRASDGTVNIWEDRCPHRGVRFSIGMVRDDQLRCQYHAWRFASGTGACTHIPAQPAARPPAAIRATVWPVAEAGGLVWTGVAPDGAPPSPGAGEALRAIAIDRDATAVAAALAGQVAPPEDGTGATVRFFLQPVAAGRCVVRGVAPVDLLRPIDAALDALRRRLEAAPC